MLLRTLAAAGLLAVGLGAVAGCTASRPSPAAAPAAAPVSGSALPADATPTEEVYFTDADHGFVLAQSCPPGGACAVWLAVTADGGRSWRGNPAPAKHGGDATMGPRLRMRVLDATRVVLDSYDYPHGKRWFTADGGKTWAELAQQPTETVEEVPAGSPATTDNRRQDGIDVVVLRRDGTSARLANHPAAAANALDTAVTDAADGSLWIKGAEMRSDQQRNWVFVSRDRGRNWVEVPLPAGYTGGTGGVPDLVDQHGRIVYAVDGSGHRAWRTRDDGRSWQQLTLSLPKSAGDNAIIGFADGNGGLIVSDLTTEKAHLVAATATVSQPTAAGQAPRQAGARYLRRDNKEPTGKRQHSADGKTWTELRF
jgi:photosystem II stability/assembly factor-like uncharacterized protein